MELGSFFNNTIGESFNQSYKIFGLYHLIWLLVPIGILTVLYFVFKKYKKAGLVLLYFSASVLLVLRAIKYLYFIPIYWSLGWKASIPYQLCTIVSFVLPFTVFFKTKNFNKFIYPLAIIGGLVTMIYPDWIFNNYSLNFNKLESLIVHTILYSIPIISVAVGRFSFKIKDYYKPVLAMALLVGYAYIANTYIIPGSNFMFLNKNPLPIEFPIHHMYIFAAAFFVALFIMYAKDAFKKPRK